MAVFPPMCVVIVLLALMTHGHVILSSPLQTLNQPKAEKARLPSPLTFPGSSPIQPINRQSHSANELSLHRSQHLQDYIDTATQGEFTMEHNNDPDTEPREDSDYQKSIYWPHSKQQDSVLSPEQRSDSRQISNNFNRIKTAGHFLTQQPWTWLQNEGDQSYKSQVKHPRHKRWQPDPDNAGHVWELSTQSLLENASEQSWIISKDVAAMELDQVISPCTYNNISVDCSYRHLPNVPDYPFPVTITQFDLSNNSITEIPDFAFFRYTNLTHLDLSRNNLSRLGIHAFEGLSQLQYLDLWNNALSMVPGRFPLGVFTPLSSLKYLFINRNTPWKSLNDTTMNYPDAALSSLTELRTLYMDGLTSKDLGPGFQYMTSLKKLILSGVKTGACKLYSLSSMMFWYVPNLEHLELDGCDLQGDRIHEETFSPLRRLVFLNVSHNEEIGLEYLDRLFFGLHDTLTLRELHMQLVINRHSIGICLDSSYISYFPQYLTYLDAGDNVFEGVDREVIRKLSPSLQILDVSANAFAFGTYFQDFPMMTNLTLFRYNGGNFTRTLPYVYPYKSAKPTRTNTPATNCSLYEEQELDEPNIKQFVLFLPPNLQFVEMNNAGLRFELTNLDVDPNNKLESLSMIGNNFPRLVGPFTGLNSLKILNLSSSNINLISNSFFRNLTSLQMLDLGSNFLGDFLYENNDVHIFSTLSKLTSLDICFNNIRQLPYTIFSGLVNLKFLRLHRNPLLRFDIDMSDLSNLEVLDLRRTRIAVLPVSIRLHMDSLLSRHMVHLNLAECPIDCNCDNLDFLTWLANSKLDLLDSGNNNYWCIDTADSLRLISDNYTSTETMLNRRCSSHIALFFCFASMTFLAVCIIAGAIVYRFRWKLRYLYYAAYLHFKQNRRMSVVEFKFDAFISYATNDSNFVLGKLLPEMERRGLKLCIHDRDFGAGDYIASNIVKAVCGSRRTVVVLTRHMMESYWCGYEIQMANMESVHTGRPVLIFLLMEKIPESKLGKEILYNIRNNTYIPYPDLLPNSTSIGRLWDRLAADIRG